MLSDLDHPKGNEMYRAARSVGEQDRETRDTIKHTEKKKNHKRNDLMYVYVSVILNLKTYQYHTTVWTDGLIKTFCSNMVQLW